MPPFTIGLPLPPVPTRVSPSTLPGIPIYNDGVPTSYYPEDRPTWDPRSWRKSVRGL
jgi:hypothetical protein